MADRLRSKLKQINIGGGTLSTTGLDGADERTVNLLPVLGPLSDQGTQTIHMENTEGLELYETTAGNSVRGLFQLNDILYFVVGSTFYTKDVTTGLKVNRGTINTTTGDVSFASIFDQVGFVDGSDGWIFTISTSTLAQITDAQFPNNVTSIAAQDGYFLVVNPGTQEMAASDLDTGSSWDASFFGLAQSNGDYAVRPQSYLDEVYVFGTATTQKFVNTGNVDFPFEPVIGATLPYGLAAERTVATGTDSIMWLGIGVNGKIRPIRVASNTVLPMFSEAIIKEMQQLSTYIDAKAFCYQDGLHEMYVLTFPAEQKTYVYDLTTGLSHDRESIKLSTLQTTRWRPECYANAGGRHFVGDFETGNIYELKKDVFTDASETIHRRRRISVFDSGGVYKTASKLIIQFGLGEALPSGQGSEPQVMLKMSHDGGRTFGAEMWRSIGTLGQFTDMAIWDSLGTAKKWCLEITMSDPIEWKVLNAWADLESHEV